MLASDLAVSRIAPVGGSAAPFDAIEVQFNRDVQDGTFTEEDVLFRGPGGAVLTLTALSKVDGSHYRLEWTGKTGLAAYSIEIGPQILDADGHPMNQDGDATPGEPEDAYRATLFSNGVTVAEGDAQYDGRGVVVYGKTGSVTGDHTFAGMEVLGGASVKSFGPTLSLSDLLVDSGSVVTLAGGSTLAVARSLDVKGNSNIVTPVYTDGETTLTLQLAAPLAEGLYQLTAKSGATVGLRDTAARPLDQNQDGFADDFVTPISVDLTPPGLVGGRPGTALAFDGVDDYVRVIDSPSLRMTSQMTLEAWIYPTGLGGGTGSGTIISRKGEYEIGRNPDGSIWWAIANSSPGWTGISTGYIAPLNQWTHLALVKASL